MPGFSLSLHCCRQLSGRSICKIHKSMTYAVAAKPFATPIIYWVHSWFLMLFGLTLNHLDPAFELWTHNNPRRRESAFVRTIHKPFFSPFNLRNRLIPGISKHNSDLCFVWIRKRREHKNEVLWTLKISERNHITFRSK